MAGLDPATQRGAQLADILTFSARSLVKRAYVYIMSNKRYGTIYVGVTNDIVRRAWEHREGIVPGFTRRYRLHDLVWFEEHATLVEAIQREHNMKHWPRRWKTALVDALNPEWNDLYPTIV